MVKGASEAAMFFARSGTDSAAPVSVPANPVSAIDTILAALGSLGEAETLQVLDAVNEHMAMLSAIVANLPAQGPAPVLSDDTVIDAKSALAQHFNRKAA